MRKKEQTAGDYTNSKRSNEERTAIDKINARRINEIRGETDKKNSKNKTTQGKRMS